MSGSFSAQDEAYMRRALALAARGQGRVEPNPMVGCVIVRGGQILGEGYHRRFGGPHAEVEALRAVGGQAAGATVYVTLEPCCHFGKTPPCTDALLGARVGRVIAAMADPFPKMAGKGAKLLRRAGIPVDFGLCERQARVLNAPYLKRQHTGLPWVILKWAQSLDGRIATRTGDSKWISSEASRRLVHQLRGRVDAIMVGVNTVIADDPLLTCRDARPRRVTARIVLDPHLRTPTGARLVRTARQVPTIIVTASGRERAGGPPNSSRLRNARLRAYERAGVRIVSISLRKNGLNLRRLLRDLAAGSIIGDFGRDSITRDVGRAGMTNVLVEGGSRTLGRLLDEKLADEALVFVSPRLIGGADAVPALGGLGPARIAQIRAPAAIERFRLGADELYRLRLREV